MSSKPIDSPAKDRGTILAEERTDVALDRTRMAAERTLMAWVRTTLSMISFGFTIKQAKPPSGVRRCPKTWGSSWCPWGRGC
jgi:putative membrane protein